MQKRQEAKPRPQRVAEAQNQATDSRWNLSKVVNLLHILRLSGDRVRPSSLIGAVHLPKHIVVEQEISSIHSTNKYVVGISVTIPSNDNIERDANSLDQDTKKRSSFRIGCQNAPNVTGSSTDLRFGASRRRNSATLADSALPRNQVLLQSRFSSGGDLSGNGDFAAPDLSLRGGAARRGVLPLAFER